MSDLTKLFKQSSHYLVGQSLVMAAGFISFSILIRVFSVDDYGILGLISTTTIIIQAITKQGFPNSIVRFFTEFKIKNNLAEFRLTIFIGYSITKAC